MSACMRSLYSSDQRAPGFRFVLLCVCGSGGILISPADLLTPALSLSVARDDVGLEDKFEVFMRLLGTSLTLNSQFAGR